MIWNEDMLFIHAPKTAGMSLTEMLIRDLPGKVFSTGAAVNKKEDNAQFIASGRHEILAPAYYLLALHNRKFSDFKAIFAVMRNPSSLQEPPYSYASTLPMGRTNANSVSCNGELP